MKGFIYLLHSLKNNKKYLGSSSAPGKRIISHNNGFTESTKNGRPWICQLLINVGNIEETRDVEKYIKSHKEKLSTKNVIRILYRYYFKNRK